jgi:hypothetical protein
MGKFADLEWATHKKTLEIQIGIVKKHSEKMIRDMINDKKVLRLTSKPESAAEYMLANYRYPEELALQSIHAAHKTLKQLNILKKERYIKI